MDKVIELEQYIWRYKRLDNKYVCIVSNKDNNEVASSKLCESIDEAFSDAKKKIS